MRIETRNLIIDKAKGKKNGCYKFRGIAYRVRDFEVTHFADCGEVYQVFGMFNVKVAVYEFHLDYVEAGRKFLLLF